MMASGSIINRVKLKGTFRGLSRSASRTGMVTTAAQRRRSKVYEARRNAQQVRERLRDNSF